MKGFDLTFKPFGESAVLIEWPARIDEDILADIIALKEAIERTSNATILESVIAYNSLTLIFDREKTTPEQLQVEVNKLRSIARKPGTSKNKLWKIPVCYNEEFGIDLQEISKVKKLSIDEIVWKHCEPTYTVYFIGFLPGFLYLGGLLSELHQPRKSIPRIRIKKGAVAIGGSQTGIYPIESPGGWNVLGNTPLSFFDPHSSPPCFASPGDRLQFYSIQLDHYHHLKEEVEIGRFKLESESI